MSRLRAMSDNPLPPPTAFFAEQDAIAKGREAAWQARHMAMKRVEYRKVRNSILAIVALCMGLWAAIWGAMSTLALWVMP